MGVPFTPYCFMSIISWPQRDLPLTLRIDIFKNGNKFIKLFTSQA